LCGHHNSKQKIQQHMQLKKELQEQTSLIKQQRDQIVELTMQIEKLLTHQKATTTVASVPLFIEETPMAAPTHQQTNPPSNATIPSMTQSYSGVRTRSSKTLKDAAIGKPTTRQPLQDRDINKAWVSELNSEI
jgi:hypothetical protein